MKMCSFGRATFGRAVFATIILSVCLFHTRESGLNGSRYWNRPILCTIQ